MKPGKGAQSARAAGAGVQRVAREGVYATLRLRSGEMRRVPAECRATIGEVGNVEHNFQKLGKAAASCWRGIKPNVRGAAKNPVEHQHGSGAATDGQGLPHSGTPWGLSTKRNKSPHQYRPKADDRSARRSITERTNI